MWIKALLVAAALTGGAAVPVMASPDLGSAVRSTLVATLGATAGEPADDAGAAREANHDARRGEHGSTDGQRGPAAGNDGGVTSETGDGRASAAHENHGENVSEAAHSADRACVGDRICHGDAVSEAALSRGRHGGGTNDRSENKPENDGPPQGADQGHGPAVSEVAHDADRACEGDRSCHGEAVREAARSQDGHGAEAHGRSADQAEQHGPSAQGSSEGPGPAVSEVAHDADHACEGNRSCHGEAVREATGHGPSDSAGQNNDHANPAAGRGGNHGPSDNAGASAGAGRGRGGRD